MLAKYLLLVYLPAIAFSRITIEMYASKNKDEFHANLDGMDEHIINEKGEQTFSLTKNDLKDLTKKYSGESCSGTYLKPPTPFGDVYQEYGWYEVEVSVLPEHYNVLHFSAKPIVLVNKTHSNKGSETIPYTSKVHKVVSEVVEHRWKKAPEVTLSQPINYVVNFGSGSLGSLASLRYTSPYGQNKVQNRSVDIKPSRSVTINIPPNESVVETLHVTKIKMAIEIGYKISVSGQVFCHYDNKHKGHYFWAYRVRQLLSDSDLHWEKFAVEHLILVFYVNARAQLHVDNDENKKGKNVYNICNY